MYINSKRLVQIFGSIEKRLRFVIATLVLSGIMLTATFFLFDAFYIFLPILIIATFFFTFFAILDGIERVEWRMLFVIPILWSVASYLFYFLFPVRWITRLPFLFVYGVSMYAILLTSNIFNVGVGKSIQLYRAAFSVNYLYQTVLSFLLLNVLFSFKPHILIQALIVGVIFYLLSVQLYWSIKPKTYLENRLNHYAYATAVLMIQLTVLFSFLPIPATILSLFATACYYSLTGILHHYLDQKLFRQTIREYVFVAVFVLGMVLLSVTW